MAEKSKRKAPGRPFKKGKPPGPGRPKGSKDGIGAHLKRMIEKAPPKEIWDKLESIGVKDAKGSNGKAIAQTLILLALKGDLQAIKLLKEFVEPGRIEIDENKTVRIIRE